MEQFLEQQHTYIAIHRSINRELKRKKKLFHSKCSFCYVFVFGRHVYRTSRTVKILDGICSREVPEAYARGKRSQSSFVCPNATSHGSAIHIYMYCILYDDWYISRCHVSDSEAGLASGAIFNSCFVFIRGPLPRWRMPHPYTEIWNDTICKLIYCFFLPHHPAMYISLSLVRQIGIETEHTIRCLSECVGCAIVQECTTTAANNQFEPRTICECSFK